MELNSAYIHELNMKKSFKSFNEANKLKQTFLEIHSRPLEKVDSIIDTW